MMLMRLTKTFISLIALVIFGMPMARGEELKESSYKIFSSSSYRWNATGMMAYQPEGWEMEQPLFYRMSDNGDEAIITSPVIDSTLKWRCGMYAGIMRVPEQVPDPTGRMVPVVGIEGFCSNGVTELYLPATIRDLGKSIWYCDMLETVIFDDSLEEINGVFNCMYLTTCSLPAGLKRVGDQSLCNTGVTSFQFPAGLEEVGELAFSYNFLLEQLDLGNLQRAGAMAFRNLPSLSKVVLPESLESLGDGSFAYCCALEELWLPSHTVQYGEGCFRYATSLQRLVCPSATPYAWPLDEVDASDIILYVPDGAEDLYRNAEGWKQSSAIRPIPELQK